MTGEVKICADGSFLPCSKIIWCQRHGALLMVRSTFFLAAIVASTTVVAFENSKPVHEEPVTISVSGKDGRSSVQGNNRIITRNPLSTTEPAEKLNVVAGEFASVVPISCCKAELLLEFQRGEYRKQVLVAWDKETFVDGKDGAETFVAVVARKLTGG
jgi:hypothetical protein